MLLRVAARYGVRVQSLQHVLEGYKVAAEIAAHGASASTFSDWWAYKIEAFDAIPFNAALMTQAGVSTVIKSDSEELIRHLYLEAAKMVKYGGVAEDQALAMITINSARELGLDRRLGSIEVGKDGDIAIFNAHPFDGFARCELALIDGEVQFQSKDGKLTPRPGDHAAMPAAAVAAEARARPLDLAISANGTYAVTGATLHPVTGPDIADGTIVISGGKIAAIGDAKTPIPAAAKVVNAKGLDLWPGLVDAGTPLGLYEVGSLQETQDSSDSAEYQPELRTAVALHPDSELIPVARANGRSGLRDRARRLGS
jgi:imidazolonepropionase-like amidohydrolase